MIQPVSVPLQSEHFWLVIHLLSSVLFEYVCRVASLIDRYTLSPDILTFLNDPIQIESHCN